MKRFKEFVETLGYCKNCESSRFVYCDWGFVFGKPSRLEFACALCFGSDRDIDKISGDWVQRPRYLFSWLGDCFYREDRHSRSQEGYCDLYDIGSCCHFCRDYIPFNPKILKIIRYPQGDNLRDRISRFQQARVNLVLLNYYPAPDPTF